MSCHALDRKLVGPAFKDVAAKYAGDKTATDKLVVKVMQGGAEVGAVVPIKTYCAAALAGMFDAQAQLTL